jgi:amidase
MSRRDNGTHGLTGPSEAGGHCPEWAPSRRTFLGATAGALASLANSSVLAQTAANTARPTNLDFASAGDAAKMIRARAISSRELTARMLDRIARFNPQLNAVVNVLGDQALTATRRADDAQARGDRLGLLHGVPIVVKDQFDLAGVPTTVGIKQLAQNRRATDAEVVRRLRAAGAIVLGNTNVPLYLNDWQSYNALYGVTNNPWDVTRTPGGSSGGSSAALAAGLAFLSPGSDRSGSLRVPAHLCGVYGHKPSLGVVSLRGWIPSAPGGPPALPEGLAVAGPMARTASDLMLSMQVLGGPDGADALAYRWSMPAPRHRRLRDYRVGFVLDDPACPVDTSVRRCLEEAVSALRKAGAALREGWPTGIDPKAQRQTYGYLLLSSLGAPPGLTDEQMRALADKGLPFAQQYFDTHRRYLEYATQQLVARRAWQAAFNDVDVFLMPSSFVAAFPHDQSEPQDARRLATSAGPRPYLDLIFWNTFATLAGLPSTAAPVGRTEQGVPVGLQILGPYLEDATPIDFAVRMAGVIGGFVSPPGFA